MPVEFKHRVEVIWEYTQLDKMITMYDFAKNEIFELVEGDNNHEEIKDVPPYIVARIQKQSVKSTWVPEREPECSFEEGEIHESMEDPDTW